MDMEIPHVWVQKARNHFVTESDAIRDLHPDRLVSSIQEDEGSNNLLSLDDLLAYISTQQSSEVVALSDTAELQNVDDGSVVYLNVSFPRSDVRSFSGFTSILKFAHALAAYFPNDMEFNPSLEVFIDKSLHAASNFAAMLPNYEWIGYCCASIAFCFSEVMFSPVNTDDVPCFLYEIQVRDGLSVFALTKRSGSDTNVIFAVKYTLHEPDAAQMDVEDIILEELPSRILVLEVEHHVHGEVKRARVEEHCPHSVDDLRRMFRTIFTLLPETFEIHVVGAGLNPITDAWIVQYAESAPGDGDEVAVARVTIHAIAIAQETAFIPVVHPSQQAVADELFSRTIKALGMLTEQDLANTYNDVRFLIMVPKFNTLKQQTKDRLRAFADLLPDDESLIDSFVDERTMIYPVTAMASRTAMDRFRDDVLAEGNVLFVLVVDECHYAPTTTAIPALHARQLHKRSNFVVLTVSATPFNCITTHSSIPPENRVEWAPTVRQRCSAATTYVGFQYYARSIAFWCKPYQVRITLCNRQGGRTESAVVSLESSLGEQEFANYETVLCKITEALNDEISRLWNSQQSGFKLSVTRTGDRCVLQGHWTTKLRKYLQTGDVYEVQLEQVDAEHCLLHALGFDTMIILQYAETESVTSLHSFRLDDDFPLTVQHLRSDKNFDALKVHLHRLFPKLVNTDGKNAQPLDPFDEAHFPANQLFTVHLLRQLLSQEFRESRNTMKARNGYSLVLDYVFSLAYFSVCQEVTVDGINGEHAREFVEKIIQCCAFVDTDGRVCNLLPIASQALEKIIQERKTELPNASGLSDLDIVVNILREKRAQQNEALTTDNESWFTETDRNVQLLLSKTEKVMIVMRVYDKDENLSMQKILRHALRLCFPVPPNTCPRFSIIGDIDRTKLYDSIEAEFRAAPIDHEVYGRCTLEEVLRRKSGAVKLDLNYEDLAGIPCLVILCEKGRMGDTFPHSLRVLDLRMRTAKQGTTLIQELGRLCRYPKMDRSRSAIVSPETLPFYPNAELRRAFPNGAGAFNADNDVFLGIVECAPQLQRIMQKLVHQSSTPRVRLDHLKYPLPYALINEGPMVIIRKGLEHREQQLISQRSTIAQQFSWEDGRNNLPILSCLKFDVLDPALAGTKSGGILRLSRSTLETKSHYDAMHAEEEYHPRRLLLSAECQIGKTGAFLAYLQRLRLAVRHGRDEILPSDIMDHPPVPATLQLHDFYIPFWQRIQQQPGWQYHRPHSGKYMLALAEQRLQALLFAARQSIHTDGLASSVQRYAATIVRWEYPGSNSGRQRLHHILSFPSPFSIDDQQHADQVDRYLRFNGDDGLQHAEALLNWDGRLTGNPDGDVVETVLRGLQETYGFNLDLRIPLAHLPVQESDVSAPVHNIWDHHLSEKEVDDDGDTLHPGEGQHAAAAVEPVNTIRPVTDIDPNYVHNPKSAVFPPSVTDENAAAWLTMSRCFEIGDASMFADTDGAHYRFAGKCRIWFPGALMQFLNRDGLVPVASLDTWEHVCQVCNALLESISPSCLRHWIFTPSYIGKHGMKYLYLHRRASFPDWTPWKHYVQVLVVRERQFELYREYFGNDYIILSLPATVTIQSHVKGDDLIRNVFQREQIFTAEQAGPGFARLFIQAFAEKIGLSAVWMIDDNVKSCYQLDQVPSSPASRKYRFTNATFKEVMAHLEAIFSGQLDDADLTQNVKGRDSIQERVQQRPFIPAPTHCLLRRDTPTTIVPSAARPRQFVGYEEQYGVLGIGRCVSGGWAGVMSEPIKVTHSVYSFFLFNVRAATKHRLYFPPRRTMEDIEMNFMMEEIGLAVVKVRSFSHLKPVRRSGVPITRPVNLFKAIQETEGLPEEFLNQAVHMQIGEDGAGNPPGNPSPFRIMVQYLLSRYRGIRHIGAVDAAGIAAVSGTVYLVHQSPDWESILQQWRQSQFVDIWQDIVLLHSQQTVQFPSYVQRLVFNKPGVVICAVESFSDWEAARAQCARYTKILRIDMVDGFVFIVFSLADHHGNNGVRRRPSPSILGTSSISPSRPSSGFLLADSRHPAGTSNRSPSSIPSSTPRGSAFRPIASSTGSEPAPRSASAGLTEHDNLPAIPSPATEATPRRPPGFPVPHDRIEEMLARWQYEGTIDGETKKSEIVRRILEELKGELTEENIAQWQKPQSTLYQSLSFDREANRWKWIRSRKRTHTEANGPNDGGK